MIENGVIAVANPSVSVIVCTRNRATHILHTASTILASDYPDFELLVVDESANDATADALAPLKSSALRYFRIAGHGKATALNYALRHARGQFLALTDDDCEMAPDCLAALAAAFRADPEVAIVFGDVAASPYDSTQEHIPKCRIPQSNTIRRPTHFLQMSVKRGAPWLNFGIGANMAIRSATLRTIEGWDPCVGPGEKFSSGDDHDLAFRMLLAGSAVHFCHRARVIHHGIRRLDSIAHDARRVGRGFGASCIKHLKCGALYHGAARTVPFHFVRLCVELLHGRRSDSASFIRGWMSGFFTGLCHPVDRKTRRFEDCRSG